MSESGSVDQYILDFLRANMQATDDEINYLKQLNHPKSTDGRFRINEDLFTYPSVILDDFLYHGNFHQTRNLNLLRDLNVRHIISICEYQVKQELFDEFNILWINLPDCMSANISGYFDQTNDLLDSCRSKNERVFVHCQAGVSRSAAIVLAYLLK